MTGCAGMTGVGRFSLRLMRLVIEYISVILLHTQGKPTFFVVDRSMDKPLLEYFRNQKDVTDLI